MTVSWFLKWEKRAKDRESISIEVLSVVLSEILALLYCSLWDAAASR